MIFRDTTEQAKTGKLLRKTQEMFNTAFFNNPTPMIISRLSDGRFKEVNTNFEALMEYTRDELIGKTAKELNLFTSGKEGMPLTKLATLGYLRNEENLIRSKSGKLKPVLFSVAPIELEDETSLLISLLDMTGLRDAEHRYRTIFDNTLEGIYQSTPDGRFLSANPAMARIFGYSSPEALMASVTDIGMQLYADSQERQRMKEMLDKEGRVMGLELKTVDQHKQLFWSRAHVYAVKNDKGEIIYYQGALEDITDRKLAEEKLKVNFEELQKTNYELDRFVYSVSHDLRSPLSSILGVITVAELQQPGEEQAGFLNMIRISILRLDEFIKNILNYSRNTRVALKTEEINFHKLLKDVQENVMFMEGAKRIQLKIETEGKVPFYCDRLRIGILIENLYSNAVKYQDYKKESSWVSISVQTTPEKAMITVQDNGMGIGKKHIHKVFDMFYRADTRVQGSGLGLYIANETIAKLGGSMQMESEPGLGTTFEISIPNHIDHEGRNREQAQDSDGD